jgi:C-terminal processing protease CtpA/Prc
MTRVLCAVGIPLLAGALALAACGSNDEDNDYVEEVNAIQEQLVDDVTETVSGAPPANPKAAAEVAGELEGVFASTADEFEAIEPPQDVAGLHDELVAAIRGVGARIGEAEKAFASGNSKQAARAALELQTATTDLQPQLTALIDDINAQLQE